MGNPIKETDEEQIMLICMQIDYFIRSGKIPFPDKLNQKQNTINFNSTSSFSTYFESIGFVPNEEQNYFIPEEYSNLIDALYNKKVKKTVKNKNKGEQINYKFTTKDIEKKKNELSIIAAYYAVFLNEFLKSTVVYELFETKKKNVKQIDNQYKILQVDAKKWHFEDFDKMIITIFRRASKVDKIKIGFTNQDVMKDIIAYAGYRELQQYAENKTLKLSIRSKAADRIFTKIGLGTKRKIKNQIFYSFTVALYDYVYNENIITQTKKKYPVPEICKFIVDFYCDIKLDPTPTQGDADPTVWDSAYSARLYKIVQLHISRHRPKPKKEAKA